ncbi:MAG: FitA-like ribbon-helix-helix domain-containing protein [Longimicrobiaceae bacterium]
MASLTVKGIPDDVLDGMRRIAEQHRRSLNSEAIVAFERAVGPVLYDPEAILAQVRAARARMAGVRSLSPEEIERAIEDGRP